MSGNYNHQQFWVAGTRFLFQRNPINNVRQPIIDFGVVDTTNPQFEKETIELVDGDGGVKRIVKEKVISVDETYEIICYNLSPEMIALTFMADPPSALSQTATPKVDIKHWAIPGRLMKILDTDYDGATDPRWTLGVASITGINSAPSSAGTAYTENDDWEWYNKERGIIRWLSSGDLAAAAAVYVTFVPRAISGDRLIVPSSGFSANIEGQGLIIWGRENNTEQTARFARFSLVSQTPNIQIDNFSNVTFTAKVLSDIALSEPAGRLEYWLGDLPDVA